MISKGFNIIEFGIIVSSILSQDKSIFKESNSKNFSREFFYKTICKNCDNTYSDVIGAYRTFKDWFKQFGFKFEEIYLKGLKNLRYKEKNFVKVNYLNFIMIFKNN